MKLIRELMEMSDGQQPSLDEIVAELIKEPEDYNFSDLHFYKTDATQISDLHSNPEIAAKLAKRAKGKYISLKVEGTISPNGVEEDLSAFLDLKMTGTQLTLDGESTSYASLPTDAQDIVEEKLNKRVNVSDMSLEDVCDMIKKEVRELMDAVESGIEAALEGSDDDDEDEDGD
jgi:hypothetical protein